ncbi:MAG: FtsW/RodA/SpoVE family cell cycle protein, partial [Alphaproteobacteria bacterium]
GVTLHIFPTKGMTLPFVSYGGSSVISFAICFGIFLNFTKKKPAINHQSNAFIMNTHVKEL